jgi:hypothetical protein
MAQGYLAQVQKLVQEKLNSQSPEERLEMLNAEMKREKPDLSLIETLLEKGVGKEFSMEKIKETIETNKKINLTPIQFEEFISKLEPDSSGIIEPKELTKIKEFLSQEEITLNVEVLTSANKFPPHANGGLNLIHIAVGMGDVELAQMLIDRGADLDKGCCNGHGRRPMQWIPSSEKTEEAKEVKELIKKRLGI